MTDNSDKIRSIVLAALMVFSVFAGTVAFAGTAAAVNDVSYTSDTFSGSVDPGTEETANIQFTVTDISSQDTTTVNVSADNGANFSSVNNIAVSGGSVESSGQVNDDGEIVFGITANSDGGNVDVTVESATAQYPSPSSDTTVTVSAIAMDSSDDSTAESDLFTVDVANSNAPTIQGATHYDRAGGPNTDGYLEIAFNEDVTIDGDSTFTIYNESGGVIAEYDGGQTSIVSQDEGQILIDVGGSSSTGQATIYPRVDVVNVSGVDDTNGNTVEPTNASVTFAATSVSVNAGGDATAFGGSNIAVIDSGGLDRSVEVTGPGDFFFSGSTGTNSEVYVLNTADRDLGEYNVTFQNDSEVTVNVRNLGLDVAADSTSLTTEDAITGDVSANAGNRLVEVTLYDSADDVVSTTDVQLDGSGEGTFDFGSVSADNYTIEATDISSGVTTSSDTINVTSAAEGQVTFAENTYSVPQGDVVNITLDVTGTTEGSLVIGQNTQSGYQANVTFVDEDEDGEVVVQFNTYTAGTNGDIVSAAGEDTASLADGDTQLASNALLAEGGYDLAVVQGQYTNGTDVFENEDSSFSSLSIGERSTDSMALWTAPASTDSDALIDSVAQDSTIASGDWVVHQVSATGLEGLVEAQGDFETAITNDVLNITVTQTEETTRQNRNPKKLDVGTALADGDVALIADAENDSYYIALDTSTDAFKRGGDTGYSADADEEYTANFTVKDDKLVGEDTADHESVNATFEVVAPAASLDQTPVEVEAATNQTISGTSTLAPGTEVQVTVQSTGDTSPRFYNNPTATVQADGTWNITVDFDEQSVNDTFSVSAGSYFDADGTVVESTTEATPTATATPEPDTETATPEPDTETATPEPTETDAPETDMPTETPEDDTTTTTTPGFGVAVALVALLAAALLAGRRE